MRITPDMGVIEVGHIAYSPALQRTKLGTEAQYLLARYAFETLGYRRYEWKCNALNAASRRAAERYGFTFEGIFRQHMVVKGKNRDTAWYSIVDTEWPARKAAFERWLAPENFDAGGRQKDEPRPHAWLRRNKTMTDVEPQGCRRDRRRPGHRPCYRGSLHCRRRDA